MKRTSNMDLIEDQLLSTLCTEYYGKIVDNYSNKMVATTLV